MLGNLSCAMSTFNAGPLIKTLSQKSALLEHTGEHPPPENWMVRDPLHGLVPAHATRVTRSLIKLDAPPKRNDDFPQIDVSSGFSWSVWPNWRLNPLLGTGQDTQDSEPLRWHSTGLCSSKPPGIGNIIIEWSPEIYRAEALARSALGALASSFGPLPWRCVRLLLEEQARDLGMAKGIAVPYSGELWCRVQLRPNSKQDAEPTEIIIHELLHYLVEFNTPAGHALTEGLITYLARLLTVQAGAAPQDWMRHISDRARRDLTRWHLCKMPYPLASRLFFQSRSARRVAYRKGHLLFQEIDTACGGRLLPIVQHLVARTSRSRLPLTEAAFVGALPGKSRRIYQDAVCSCRPCGKRPMKRERSI